MGPHNPSRREGPANIKILRDLVVRADTCKAAIKKTERICLTYVTYDVQYTLCERTQAAS